MRIIDFVLSSNALFLSSAVLSLVVGLSDTFPHSNNYF
jgi:hypothetical protein